jgi:hypothetical protein
VAYFAPTIIEFQRMAYSSAVDQALVREAAQWRSMNIIRVIVFMALNLLMIPLPVRVGKMLCETTKA